MTEEPKWRKGLTPEQALAKATEILSMMPTDQVDRIIFLLDQNRDEPRFNGHPGYEGDPGLEG
jgi:hypothetical protein